MEYRSIGDLSRSIADNSWRVPADIDLIVGVPRSGMLAGSILALHLNLPLMDIGCLLGARDARIGRTSHHTVKTKETRSRKILIIDDSIDTGLSMAAVRKEIVEAGIDDECIFGAIYGARPRHEETDIIFETIATPRIFEWNLLRHKRIADACCDIDGVLCHDPDHSQNDDGPAYGAFLRDALPLRLPKLPIKHVVTSRLEKYRKETEEWLRSAGIEYEQLWMLDLPSAEERRRQGAHAAFKAKIYRETGASLFIESDDKQAEDIARLSERPVLSIEGQRMVWPDDPVANRRHIKRAGWAKKRRSPLAASLARILGERNYRSLRSALKGR